MRIQKDTKQPDMKIRNNDKNAVEMKCSFCGAPKEKTNILVQGIHDGMICDTCIEEAHRLYKTEFKQNEPEIDLSIRKTARAIAGNREIIINVFHDTYSLTTRRFKQINNSDNIDEISHTTNLTEATLCLLIRLLNKTVEEFNIDVESIITEFKGDSEVYETFKDFSAKVKE
jgi:transposase-like protein